MKTRIVQIGNSRGVRLPKAILEQAHLGEEVEIEVERDQIIIRSVHVPRAGWDEAFRVMADRGDDRLIGEPAAPTAFDKSEWTW